MFTQPWKKYLPVIRILLKRSLRTDQTLDMDESDFKRAGAKKVKFTFSAVITNGRLSGPAVSPLASDFCAVLLQDDLVIEFLRNKTIMFTTLNNFQLQIKNITPTDEAELKTAETTVASKEENAQ